MVSGDAGEVIEALVTSLSGRVSQHEAELVARGCSGWRLTLLGLQPSHALCAVSDVLQPSLASGQTLIFGVSVS